MLKVVDVITHYCIKEGIVKADDAPWLRYGLEKRIATLLVGIPFFILAFTISNFTCAIAFFITYFYVKKYLGGYHAQTIWKCLLYSLLMELAFLLIMPRLLISLTFLVMLAGSVLIVLKLAPYNHPNLHLTKDEVIACRKQGRKRIYISSLVAIVSWLAGLREFAKGCTIGIVMASTLLCLGYINEWRNIQHERKND